MSRFNHLITILEKNSQKNWSEKYKLFANITPVNKDNFLFNLAKYNNFNLYFVFKIRFIEQITSNMRIKFNNRLFSINKIINLEEKNKFLEIFSLEITNIGGTQCL